MRIMGAIIIFLSTCLLVDRAEFRKYFSNTAGILVAILVILWLWHAAGLWPFK